MTNVYPGIHNKLTLTIYSVDLERVSKESFKTCIVDHFQTATLPVGFKFANPNLCKHDAELAEYYEVHKCAEDGYVIGAGYIFEPTEGPLVTRYMKMSTASLIKRPVDEIADLLMQRATTQWPADLFASTSK